MWDFPGPGIEPVYPALTSTFLTTGPPGKSSHHCFIPLPWVWLFPAWCTPLYAAAKSLQLCLTLRDPIDSSPPGSPVPGILQARTLEWVAVSFSKAWKWKVKVKSLSRVQPSATPWTAAFQAPPSMGFSRQQYWSGVPLTPLTPLYNRGKIFLPNSKMLAAYLCHSLLSLQYFPSPLA